MYSIYFRKYTSISQELSLNYFVIHLRHKVNHIRTPHFNVVKVQTAFSYNHLISLTPENSTRTLKRETSYANSHTDVSLGL
jgi:hypothetical protein